MPARHPPLAALAAALLALAAPARSTAPGPAPSATPPAGSPRAADAPPDEPAVAEVTLAELRARRGHWLGREVAFTLQVESEPETWRSWLTRFTPARYRALRAWGDEAFLWERAAFDDPAPHLFAARGSAAERALAGARRYDRFRVRAAVREVFLDEPWVELLEVERLPERIEEGTLVHALRALELLEQKSYVLAANELERAAAPSRLPARVVTELARLRALCDGR